MTSRDMESPIARSRRIPQRSILALPPIQVAVGSTNPLIGIDRHRRPPLEGKTAE